MPKLCEYQNCFKRASYGYDKLERCNKHKEDRKYIDKKCQCGEKLPTFNLPGEKKAICCSSCKTDDMVDVINKKLFETNKFAKTKWNAAAGLKLNEPI